MGIIGRSKERPRAGRLRPAQSGMVMSSSPFVEGLWADNGHLQSPMLVSALLKVPCNAHGLALTVTGLKALSSLLTF